MSRNILSVKKTKYIIILCFLFIGVRINAKGNNYLLRNIKFSHYLNGVDKETTKKGTVLQLLKDEWIRNDELLIDTNVFYIPDSNNQESPSIAFDGTNYLIVWQDYRNGSWDIYGTRITQSGILLDPLGIIISNATNSQCEPSVAFDGTNYLIVWQDYRNGSWDIYGTRVDQSGEILDTAGIAISNALFDQEYPSVAFDGTNYLVVWQDSRNGSADIYCTRVTQSGIILDSIGIAISTATNWQGYPSVAFDGTNYLVVWEDARNDWDIYGGRVSQTGNVLDPTGIPISTAAYWQWAPSITFDSINYLIVWQDYRNGSWDVYGTRVSQAGTILDPLGITISTAINDQWSPSIACDGANYFVTWEDERSGLDSDIYGSRITQSGVVVDPAGILISRTIHWQAYPSIAFDSINYMVVWQDFRYNSDYDIYCTRITQSGFILDSLGRPISTVANDQGFASVTSNGIDYLVVWHDRRNGSYDIYGARVDQLGFVIDSVSLAISTEAGDQVFPSVAFDGTNYLIVWQDYRNNDSISDIYGSRVNQNGEVLDSTGIAISTATDDQEFPSIAFDGTNYLIVWQDYRDGSWDIYGTRISQFGDILDPTGIPILTLGYDQESPSVAFDDSNYLVVWHDFRNGPYYPEIYGTRVNQSGEILDTTGIAISIAVGRQLYPSVAFDGTNYLVIWQDGRHASWDIYGTRVNQSGIVLEPLGIPISIAEYWQESPSIAFDGTNYLIVWQDYRNNDSISDIYGVKLSPIGTLLDTFAVSLQSGQQVSPVLAHGHGNQLLITYAGWTDHINVWPINTSRVWGKFYPFLVIEEPKLRELHYATLSILPNPFRRIATLRFEINKYSTISLKIYDNSGKLVRSLLSSVLEPGFHTTTWDGTDDFGRIVPNGVYFIRLKASENLQTRKIVFTK